HRDLKPSNIMVGAFGEVQVMDWGLAKVVGIQAADETAARAVDTVQTAVPGLSSETGRSIGTPLFMAPEQARGEEVDQRTDGFGLGGLLCAILTGQPPHGPAPAPDVVRRTASGDLSEAHARLDSCRADPELVRLARACLAPLREQRLPDAGAVARAVAEYQEGVRDRLRWAEVERTQVEVRASEEGRRRRLTVWLSAALLGVGGVAGLGGGGVGAAGGSWRLERRRAEARAAEERQAERALEASEAALTRLDELRRQARWREAQGLLSAVQALMVEGPEPLRRRLDQARADLSL